MLVDTHTHLNFRAFKEDWKQVVDGAVKSGVEKILVVGTDLKSSERAVEMAEENSALFASVGVHPHHARGLMEEVLRLFGSSHRSRSAQDDTVALQSLATVSKELEKLAKHKRVVAIGEVGLDYHKYQDTRYQIPDTKDEWEKIKEMQRQLLTMQVELAAKLQKPLILHSREAGEDVLNQVRNPKSEIRNPIKGVFHCFDGSKKYLKKILVAGFYVSFTGNITYVPDRAGVAKEVPLDRLILETDAPFMAPAPRRDKKSSKAYNLRSTPGDVKIIAGFHAKKRGVKLSDVVRQTTQNSRELFGF